MQNVEKATSEKRFLNLEDSKLLKAEPVEVRENSDESEERSSRTPKQITH